MIEIECHTVGNSAKPRKIEQFPRITSDVSYNVFFREFMEANIPCIISKSLTQDWTAKKDWVSENGTPNVEHFATHYGSYEVPVANCGQKHFDSQQKKTLILQDYINYWKHERNTDTEADSKCLYLKDWHFVKAFPEQKVYTTPQFFASDWLNEFWEGRKDASDDYRFVYLGPRGSWTPFHCDVFQSYSWSSNICGRKKWVFYPPGEELKLKDKFGTLVYDVYSTELKDTAQYPRAGESAAGIEVMQEPGETLFVPSGWHHQVTNLEDTLSINHNWINATNIDRVWCALQDALLEVEKSISDCIGMDKWGEQCQLLLKATHGMDLMEYYKLIQAIAHRRMHALKCNEDVVVMDGHRQGRNHTLYDASKLQTTLELLINDARIADLETFEQIEEHPTKLLDQITDVL
uniref:2-oxoglutarate and iron-dependent oxygenase JMJD4 n=2 Tax=Hirondellea gigas TaxID=1518452 RepID=A0A2P2ICK6_9CRUS